MDANVNNFLHVHSLVGNTFSTTHLKCSEFTWFSTTSMPMTPVANSVLPYGYVEIILRNLPEMKR